MAPKKTAKLERVSESKAAETAELPRGPSMMEGFPH